MKQIFSLTLLLISSIVASVAQNNFVYVRYNVQDGNAGVIIDYIEKNCNFESSSVNTTLFYSNGLDPIICHTKKEWQELRHILIGQQNTSDYDAEFETDSVNSVLTNVFNETVETSNGISLIGNNDEQNRCTFILSDDILSNPDDSDMIARVISVNELERRGISVKIVAYNDKTTYIFNNKIKNNNLYSY